jgi:hypothetical protein
MPPPVNIVNCDFQCGINVAKNSVGTTQLHMTSYSNLTRRRAAFGPMIIERVPVTQRWYIVTRGRKVGVFQGLMNAREQVKKISGALWGGVSSEQEGGIEFARCITKGQVWILEVKAAPVQVTPLMYYGESLYYGATVDNMIGKDTNLVEETLDANIGGGTGMEGVGAN